jgi:hypothetical protein
VKDPFGARPGDHQKDSCTAKRNYGRLDMESPMHNKKRNDSKQDAKRFFSKPLSFR